VTPPLALCHYTMIEVPPPDLVTLAAGAGFDAVSLMVEFPLAGRSSVAWMNSGSRYPIHGDTAMRRDTKRRLDDTGTMLVDASTCRLQPDTDVELFWPMVEAAAYLGARQINSNGDDPDGGRLVDRFAALCGMAADHGLLVGMEFQATTRIRTVADAVDLIVGAGVSNAAVTVDALHLARSGGCPDDVAQLPPGMVAYVQLCDGPASMDPDRYGWEAGTERLLPGDGEFPLGDLVACVPTEVVIGAEVPSSSRREAGISAQQYAGMVKRSLLTVTTSARRGVAGSR
jgi:sugar phosphate isomerase/epimerase